LIATESLEEFQIEKESSLFIPFLGAFLSAILTILWIKVRQIEQMTKKILDRQEVPNKAPLICEI
jgi:hypothetical protein